MTATTTNSVSSAVATVEKPTPGSMVRAYSDSFAAVLPTHVKPETWVRLAQGALKKGKKVQIGEHTGTELELAALNNPAVFLAALSDAARLGLEPGTEQYYLTPRKVKGRLEILGIIGYQGYIELMYRAGAISSVVAECVYSNDSFSYRPGRDQYPNHEIDWDADDRGSLRLVYSYAVMKDGATSKVVVLNRQAINKIKASSVGANSEYSPWKQHEPSMWLKSAVRQLAKWVPTSAEYRTSPAALEQGGSPNGFAPALEGPKQLGEDWVEAEVDIHDGEIVDEEPATTAVAMITQPQSTKLHAALNSCGITKRPDVLTTLGMMVGRTIGSSNELTGIEANDILDVLDRIVANDNPGAALDYYVANLDTAGGES